MTTRDDLRATLDAYADRDEVRGAGAVWAAATEPSEPPVGEPGLVAGGSTTSFGSDEHGAPSSTEVGPGPTAGSVPAIRPGRRRLVAAALAAACILLVATIVAVRSTTDDLDLVTTPTPDTTPEPPDGVAPRAPIAPVTVPDGTVQVVESAFGRIWVATSDRRASPRSHLRSFDPASGQLLTDMSVEGRIYALASTDRWLWARAGSIGDPPIDDERGGLLDNAIHRIDPATGTGTLEASFAGDGPIAAFGSELAAADTVHVAITDDADNSTTVTATIAEAVGHDNLVGEVGGSWGYLGLYALAFGPDGLFGLYASGRDLVQIDPETARHIVTRTFDEGLGPFGPHTAVADGVIWLAGDTGLVGVELPLAINASRPERSVRTPDGTVDLAPVGQGVAVLTSSNAAVADGAGLGPISTTVTPDRMRDVVVHDGRPWIAEWASTDPSVGATITFLAMRIDDSAPSGEPGTAPAPTPPSTTFGDGAPTIAVMHTGPLIEGEVTSVVGAGLPPGPAMVAVCAPSDRVVVELCFDPLNLDPDSFVTVEDDGSFILPWVIDRSVYGDRWQDCAQVACTLEVAGVDANGKPDTASVLASTPLVFDGTAPPIRPTLTVSPSGQVRVGTTLTVTGEGFPVAADLGLSMCQTGVSASCTANPASWELTIGPDGTLDATFTVSTGGAGPDNSVDCTASPGACSLAVFPWEAAVEPFATVPLDIAP